MISDKSITKQQSNTLLIVSIIHHLNGNSRFFYAVEFKNRNPNNSFYD
jgi:hypothetical protein